MEPALSMHDREVFRKCLDILIKNKDKPEQYDEGDKEAIINAVKASSILTL